MLFGIYWSGSVNLRVLVSNLCLTHMSVTNFTVGIIRVIAHLGPEYGYPAKNGYSNNWGSGSGFESESESMQWEQFLYSTM